MGLKAIFAILIFAYALNVFSSEIEWNQLISETNQAQLQLAIEIRTQLELVEQKNLKDLTVSKTVSLEGSSLNIF